MQIAIDIPDEYIKQLEPDLESLSQQVLELWVVEAYKNKKITSAEVGKILDLDRFKVDEFLKHKGAYLHYNLDDFWGDLRTLKSLRADLQ